MNFLTNSLIFIVIVAMGMAASYRWGMSKARGNTARKINKGNEDANEIAHKIRINTKYRNSIRRLFDKR